MPTIRTVLLNAVAARPNHTFVRWKANKAWHEWSFSELHGRARVVAESLSRFGIRPGDRVALMMENRPEWMSTYLGLSCCGVTVVPVDAKLQPNEVSHILRDSEASAFFGSAHVWKLIREIEGNLSNLKHVVILDGVVSQEFKDNGVRHYDYDTLLSQLAEAAEAPDSYFNCHVAQEDDVASIIYTSGTTGRSKGACLTHRNFLSQVTALEIFSVSNDDNFLMVLPLHHAFAFSACFIIPLAAQCEVSIVENLRTIAENMRETRPTVLLAVPLLAEKMYNAVWKKLSKNVVGRTMLSIGLGALVGKKINQSLGGRLRLIICGGAASSLEVLRAWNRLGIRTIEGYGLTETAPILSVNPDRKARLGSVGVALPSCQIRIANPNEEGIGEIQAKGTGIMKGYFRNENATRECFEDGWFCTGDLGRMDEEGYVYITGRKKALIVNREGKNIYPEEVEIAINNCPHILESIVLGYHVPEEENGEHVGAIIVPNLDLIDEERKSSSLSPLSDEEIRTLCLNEVRAAMKKLASYKHPRRIQVRFEPLQKTQTLKVKRYLYSLD